MPVLARPGGNISYSVTGSGFPAVLLSHGYGATSAMFAPNLAAMAAGNQVVTWDLPGHGASESPTDPVCYTAAAALADMTAILDELGHDQVVLGGHSLGGYLSLDFTQVYPSRVAGLILIGTGPGFRNDAAREEWNRRAEATAARIAEQGLAAMNGSAELHGGQHRDPDGLVMAARHTLTQRDAHVMNALPAITAPALIVVGGEDKQFLAAADYMAAKIRGARKAVIPAAGHAPNVDSPAAFNTLVREFLDEIAVAGQAQS
jgi:pimeloyl-ACP methyl ester carboxylesterase